MLQRGFVTVTVTPSTPAPTWTPTGSPPSPFRLKQDIWAVFWKSKGKLAHHNKEMFQQMLKIRIHQLSISTLKQLRLFPLLFSRPRSHRGLEMKLTFLSFWYLKWVIISTLELNKPDIWQHPRPGLPWPSHGLQTTTPYWKRFVFFKKRNTQDTQSKKIALNKRRHPKEAEWE